MRDHVPRRDPRRLAGLALVVIVLVSACSGSTQQSAPPAGTISIGIPLPEGDHVETFRKAEAQLRMESREKAGLSKLGPGALEFAGLMDRTASFLLTQLPARLSKLARSGGSGGRLAVPLGDLPAPGVPIFGTYLMTSVLFSELIGHGEDKKGTATLDPTTDEVTVAGSKGSITTTTTATVAISGSKVSLDITMKVEGEVRDAVSGALLYKVSNEATGHADGDACPDPSGAAVVQMSFTGKEDYFDASGAKTGSKVSEGFGGELRIKADENAKLAGIDLTPKGQGAELMLRMAANSTAPPVEKYWRSGKCIEVLVDPKGGEVDRESVTSVTAKVKHKIEGNELDKPVEAKLTSGVKSIEPAGSRQKAPAKFQFTAGSDAGDQGGVSFESVSNRGIGRTSVTFTVGGGWTISSSGTSSENFQGVVANDFKVSVTDLKVTAGKDNALSGTGTLTLSGVVTSGGFCRGEIDQTTKVTATGTLVGTGPTAVLRLSLASPAVPGVIVNMTCGGQVTALGAEGHTDRYGLALGQIELPADGGSKTISRAASLGGTMNVTATGTFTVARPKR
ncbi:MAG: hypothetical protein M3Q61_06085 [Chloroflexota bacterium]|nr:hypothetical protein [Chloroflexota bacterium]